MVKNVVTLELLGANSWERFKRVWMKALEDYPSAFGTTLERLEAQTEEVWRSKIDAMNTLVASVENSDVGVLRYGRHRDFPDWFILVGFWVMPEFRGTQNANDMYEFVRAHIREVREAEGNESVAGITLWVLSENFRARGFYERLGLHYGAVGRAKSDKWTGMIDTDF